MFEIFLKGLTGLFIVAITPGAIPFAIGVGVVVLVRWWKKRHQVSSEDKPTV